MAPPRSISVEAQLLLRDSGKAEATLRLILIEDSPDYALLIQEMLREACAGDLAIVHHTSLDAARADLRAAEADCVLLDLGLPDTRGLDGLAQVQELAPRLPVIVLSGEQSEGIAVHAVHEGAQDYLVKHDASGELVLRSVRYAVERKRAQVELTHQALHDSLTGLPNRTLLLDRIEIGLARAERAGHRLAVQFLDLDRFKLVNDTLGHEAGDRLLCAVAERLQGLTRPSDTVARLGGDEFMVLCDSIVDERQAIVMAERLSGGLAEPFVIDGRDVFAGASIGIAFGATRARTAGAMIRDADQAMYKAKQNGTRYEVAESGASRQSVVRLSTERQLHRALERNELRLYYQPEVDLHERTIFSVEALLRWAHPERGMLAPANFLQAAEESGLIVPIGEWVISTACAQLAEWRRAGLCAPKMTASINLSLRQLAEPGLIQTVEKILSDASIPAEALCFEITESVVAADHQEVISHLHDLRALGVGLSLDDFGTGLSSLSALDRYPLDMLKIDRSFVARLAEGARAERMFSAVLGAARAVGLKAVAEGVENRGQLETVDRLGCDAAQGFHLCRPEAASRIATKLLGTPALAAA